MKSKSEPSYIVLQRTIPRGNSRDANEIWKKFKAYIAHIEKTPVLEQKHVHFKGQVLPYYEKKFRPLIKSEMLRFIKVTSPTWHRWQVEREDLKSVIEDIENIIYEQKLIGGYANQFNTTITAQDLGLVTKLDVESKDVGLEEFLQSRIDDDTYQTAYEKRRHSHKSR